jgi:parallel beta-helix repeat protein
MTSSYLPNTGKGRNRVSGIFRALTLSLLIVAVASIPAMANPAVPITSCGTVISQPGQYFLANDLSCGASPVAPTTGASNPLAAWGPLQNPLDGSTIVQPHPPSAGDGIDIIADHVDLDLNGHTIDGGGSGTFGISVGVAGATPGNAHVHITGPGTVTGFEFGVIFNQVSFSSVSDVAASGNFFDFFLTSPSPSCLPACVSTKNDLEGNTATNSAGGFELIGANDNTVRDNTASGDFFGISVAFGTGNDVRGNTVTGSVGGIVLGLVFPFGAGTATDNDVTHNTAQGNGLDLFDINANCDSNTWKHNTFGTANQPCIQ